MLMTLTLVPKKMSHHKEITHVKYESCFTYHSKVIANGKVFSRQTEKQTERQKLNAPDLSMKVTFDR